MRITLDKSLIAGRRLEVDANNGTQFIPLTADLAAKCGYSVDANPYGNSKIFASLLSCFSADREDKVFDMTLRLRMYNGHTSAVDMQEVSKTCRNQWVSREILCETNYMEVSVDRLPPEMDRSTQSLLNRHGSNVAPEKLDYALTPITSLKHIWKMVFQYGPSKEKPMFLNEARDAGYGVATSPSRLIIRSPYDAREVYTENVAGVPMKVFKVTTYFKEKWSVTMLDTAAVCPAGGLKFIEDRIIWTVPRHINPLLTSTTSETLEVHMGIDGKILTNAEMAAKGYVMSVSESHIVIELPIGGSDGFYKSRAVDNQYHITYIIKPMVEIVWREEDSDHLTRYKAFFPINTPLMRRPLVVINYTVPEEQMFDVLLGAFLEDVELVNITLQAGSLSVAQANVRGYNIQEQRLANGSKTFTLHVPFSDSAVFQSSPNPVTIVYTLPLVFGLLVKPEQSMFTHPVLLEAVLQLAALPTVTGSCDEGYYHVTVEYGGQGKYFKTMLGKRELTSVLAEEYGLTENSTHMSFAVPFLAPDAVVSLVQSTAVRGRLDLVFWDPFNNRRISDFSLGCTFPMAMIECFSNGTMTALAVKAESVTSLIPSQLTLKDPSCPPIFSNDRFAYFSFDVNRCGTTRKFFDGFMIYENEICLAHGNARKYSKTTDLDYCLTVSCYYIINETQQIVLNTNSQTITHGVEIGIGELPVRIRLATDISYSTFYSNEDYPVHKHLRHPLYFEVELVDSTDPHIELVLKNCWATLGGERLSTPSWDLVVDGCENFEDNLHTTLHPVTRDTRVQFPSHIKRFDFKMFAFVNDTLGVTDQIFVHCDTVLCDSIKHDYGECSSQCVGLPTIKSVKRGSRGTGQAPQSKSYISSGPVKLSNLLLAGL
ncbi:zona pellucida protein AX 1 [Denticeps clupeoides]|uniref:zona pellucida protein AX 1 n=1 Tax=Denticeps clupeoides TaxID=299321 RepID=UPI0010A53302|nr:uncharacterized protein LOC114803307 [Denticeps clupeoides]